MMAKITFMGAGSTVFAKNVHFNPGFKGIRVCSI
jgi:hypothetical protein